GIEPFAVEVYFAAVGSRYLIDDPDEGCFSGAIGTKQTKNSAFFHMGGDVIQGPVIGILFYDVSDFQHTCVRGSVSCPFDDVRWGLLQLDSQCSLSGGSFPGFLTIQKCRGVK